MYGPENEMSNKNKWHTPHDTAPKHAELNPIITIHGPDESLYVIADFSLPGTPRMRRIMSKKLANGNINAVIYEGIVGSDRTCKKKFNLLYMNNASKEKFWKAVQTLQLLYQAAGGISEVRNYEGKTIRQAADLMRQHGNAQVWTEPEERKHNL